MKRKLKIDWDRGTPGDATDCPVYHCLTDAGFYPRAVCASEVCWCSFRSHTGVPPKLGEAILHFDRVKESLPTIDEFYIDLDTYEMTDV